MAEKDLPVVAWMHFEDGDRVCPVKQWGTETLASERGYTVSLVRLSDAQAAVAALQQENERLRTALRSVVSHWNEFGPEDGFDEAVHLRGPGSGGNSGQGAGAMSATMPYMPFLRQCTFRYPWRIEGRVTAFHPWKPICVAADIEPACEAARIEREKAKWQAVRVRVR